MPIGGIGLEAQINFRDGGFYLTAISDEQTPETLAQRMTGGGFVICEDSRWGGRHRVIVVNLADVSSIVLDVNHESEAS